MVTGELRPADVGLVGPLIASVHPRGARVDAATVIDIGRSYLAPGLIDTHMHVESSMVTSGRLRGGCIAARRDDHRLGPT